MLTLREGILIQGKYRLERLLARGGMGSIWVGRDERLRRPVAVKFMDPQFAMSVEGRARFEREAQAAAQLQTPHVVQIFDHGVDGDTPFIVMELLEGEDLGKRLKDAHRLSLAATSRMVSQIAKALRRAHEAGVVHRDLKPQNVFLARSDDEEVVKILDFGVAKAHLEGDDGEATRTGSVLGSPKYMSPEQARGLRSVDLRSDLWSLGVIIFRAVTGETPFQGESAGDLIVKICSDPIPRPSQIARDLPPEVDAFFARALSRELAGRFQTATELAAAFSEVAGVRGETSHAPYFAPSPGPVSIEPTPAPYARTGAPADVQSVSWPGTLSNAANSPPSLRPPRARTAPVLLGVVGALTFLVLALAGFLGLRGLRASPGAPASSIEATATSAAPASSVAPPALAAAPVPGETAIPEAPPTIDSVAPVAESPPPPPSASSARPAAAPPPPPPSVQGDAPKSVAQKAPAAAAPAAPPKKKPNWGY